MHEADLADELRRRHGVTTITRLATIGITRRSVDVLVRQGRLRRVGNGVLVTTWPDTLEHRMATACAITGGVIVFPTAGTAWEFRKSLRTTDVHVAVAEDRRVRSKPGLRVHRVKHLPETDVVRRADGIDITSPPRTAVDAAGVLSHNDLESLIEQGIDRKYFTITTVWRVFEPLRGKGWPGSARLAAVLNGRERWKKPVRSDHELRLERAMRKRGFPPLVREHRLVLASGDVIHPDLGVPEYGFYVEVDHLTWHAEQQRVYDHDRDLKVRATGYHVERVTNVAMDRDLAGTVENLWTVWQRILRTETHL